MACLLYGVTQPGSGITVNAQVCRSVVQSRELLELRVYWSEIANAEECFGTAEALKQAALQFHEVLREILATVTLIPFRFPALLESEDGMGQVLAADQEMYRKALARIGDSVQYELIGSWAEAQADLAAPVSGREYLQRRQAAAARIAAIDTKLRNVTAGAVREWRARQERKTHRWFALVPRSNRERFLASLRSAAPSEGMRLRVSGPWPPSEFVQPQVNHE